MARTDQRDVFEETFRIRRLVGFALVPSAILLGGFLYFFFYYPSVSAVSYAVLFAFGFGLFTTTIFLGMRLSVRTCLLAMPIGCAWLGLGWLIYQFLGSWPPRFAPA